MPPCAGVACDESSGDVIRRSAGTWSQSEGYIQQNHCACTVGHVMMLGGARVKSMVPRDALHGGPGKALVTIAERTVTKQLTSGRQAGDREHRQAWHANACA